MSSVVVEGAEIRGPDGQGDGIPLGVMSGVMVEDFPQRKIGEEVGISIDGMLGQGFLEQCDLELDAGQGFLRAWNPGSFAEEQVGSGWKALTTLKLPADLQGLLLSVPGGLEPVVGIVDTGASHTVLNRNAAYVLGLEVSAAESGMQSRFVRGIGLDSSQLEMPLVTVSNVMLGGASQVTIVPRARATASDRLSWSFRNVVCPPAERIGPLDSVAMAVGDIGIFEQLLTQNQDTIGDFKGPAALLGQDILAQLPLRLSVKSGRLWLRQS